MNIIGSGGLAKQIKDVVNSFFTYSITYGGRITITENDDTKPYVIGVGSLKEINVREEIYDKLKKEGKKVGSIVAPSAKVSPDITMEEGAVILNNVFIGPGALLDVNVLIGTGAIVEHDVLIGQHTVILTGAIVNGNCNIGCRCMIGSGAVLIHGIKICDDVTIGAGAVVIEDIVEPGTYVGCPAERVGVPI